MDNKYTTTEEEKEEEDKHEIFFSGNNVERDDMSKRSYKNTFGQVKDEPYGCPYGACGRKFVSAGQLKQHVERRHAPNIKKKEEPPQDEQIDTSSKPKKQPQPSITIVQTPIHNKMKNPNKNFEEDRPRPTTSGANMGVFKAAPRPVTSHGRQNQGAISAH